MNNSRIYVNRTRRSHPSISPYNKSVETDKTYGLPRNHGCRRNYTFTPKEIAIRPPGGGVMPNEKTLAKPCEESTGSARPGGDPFETDCRLRRKPWAQRVVRALRHPRKRPVVELNAKLLETQVFDVYRAKGLSPNTMTGRKLPFGTLGRSLFRRKS